LQNEFPNYIKDKYNFTGVYIGLYDMPFKIPDEDDDDPMAHFDIKRDTCITYIGSSKDHKFLLGKELPK
jgi:hypothetical protein